ncbi:uncharacterized protein Dana_GF27174 [Drosophila ananassae]|uniref:Uncharacterized protein n=1 Tax=Drosophila ananassae TaxID=7217 RepID=A0A0P8Y1R0_DROAN|nr:uncharacterized protein LOC26514583 [Drosophila ananassae]KPU80696.1 uncharacterized protein Dana_GF27174 [Drosophila ananassae]
MSLSSIKQKETKGKKKTLPKLRTILANPYKNHSPLLSEDEVLQFSSIIKNSMKNCNDKTKAFPSRYGIHLGLESTLRAINSKRFSFMIVSLSLRPAHLIRLIATSASVKVPTAPIYAQPKLEDLTEDIFGIRATALTLPLDLKTISEDLDKWVIARKKDPPISKKIVSKTKKSTKTRKVQDQKDKECKESQKKENEVSTSPVKKEWDDDFISFSDEKTSIKLDKIDIQVETKQLGAALSNLAMKARSQAKNDVKFEIPRKKEESPCIEPMEIQNEDEIDEDEFLPSENLSTYRPLTVQQICPNPNKKPKKKRNKKQKELAK